MGNKYKYQVSWLCLLSFLSLENRGATVSLSSPLLSAGTRTEAMWWAHWEQHGDGLLPHSRPVSMPGFYLFFVDTILWVNTDSKQKRGGGSISVSLALVQFHQYLDFIFNIALRSRRPGLLCGSCWRHFWRSSSTRMFKKLKNTLEHMNLLFLSNLHTSSPQR